MMMLPSRIVRRRLNGDQAITATRGTVRFRAGPPAGAAASASLPVVLDIRLCGAGAPALRDARRGLGALVAALGVVVRHDRLPVEELQTGIDLSLIHI